MNAKVEALLAKLSGNSTINIIDITDPGKDLDDEQKFLLLAGLQRAGLVNVMGVVANLDPPKDRAKLAKGTFKMLNMPDVPVGVGSDCFKGGQNLKHETDVFYATGVKEDELEHGMDLLLRLLDTADDKSVTICCNSGLTDMARLCMMWPDLVIQKVKEVVIMGGVQAVQEPSAVGAPPTLATVAGPDKVRYLVPDDAANNAFDWPAAVYLYQWLQENNVPMVVFMRWAPYACQFPFSVYDQFAETSNPIGANLLDRQKPSINQLWAAANAPEGSPVRGKLPMSRNRQWFVDVFCKGKDPGIGGEDEVWPFVGDYNQYDPMAVAAAVPAIRDMFFDTVEIKVKGTTHLVIGPTKEWHCVKEANGLRDLIVGLEVDALNAGVF